MAFRNVPEVGKEFCDAEFVTAHLRLTDTFGNEIGTGISRACWLNEKADAADINVAETQHIVLLLRGGDQPNIASIPYKRRETTSCGDAISDGNIDLALDQIAQIEVTLVDGEGIPLLAPIRIGINTSTFAGQVV